SGVPQPASKSESRAAGFAFYTPQVPPTLLAPFSRFASSYLWPLLHGIPDKAKFEPESWKAFKQVSEIIASDCLSVSAWSFPTLCWLHDHQLALVAPLMSMQAGVILSHFWHVPWPAPEVMAASPVGKELTEALLSNRLIGFHTNEYATNFLNTVQEL